MAPNPSVTMSTSQTKRLDRSIHSRVEAVMAIRISTPPMVGVPVLIRWVCGPSWRTAWPTFIAVSLRITPGPAIRPMNKAVSVLITARKVM
ncbi:hypothetical protein GALL_239040 [mine drainage metagenome]|uniref:Uncharacterized protein n=1 Tax=mine drainage metagenome TaxID=410659 RepID=A0A1J5RDB1_9ZZZZ